MEKTDYRKIRKTKEDILPTFITDDMFQKSEIVQIGVSNSIGHYVFDPQKKLCLFPGKSIHERRKIEIIRCKKGKTLKYRYFLTDRSGEWYPFEDHETIGIVYEIKFRWHFDD